MKHLINTINQKGGKMKQEKNIEKLELKPFSWRLGMSMVIARFYSPFACPALV